MPLYNKRKYAPKSGFVARKRRKTTSMVRRVKSRIRTKNLAMRLFERKKKYVEDNEVSISTLTGYHCQSTIMNVAHGTGYAGFEGHYIRGSGISIKGWIKNNATTTVVLRMLVLVRKLGVLDTEIATGNGLLENDGGDLGPFSSLSSVRKMNGRINGEKYIALRDKKIRLGSSSATDGSDARTINTWINLKGRQYRYNGSPTSPIKNDIVVVFFPCLANNDESLGETVELNFGYNFYYVDP